MPCLVKTFFNSRRVNSTPSIRADAAARLAQDCIRKVEVLEYPELGMEAIWKIEVEDFPAFIVVDDKGHDFFASVTKPVAFTIEKRTGLL